MSEFAPTDTTLTFDLWPSGNPDGWTRTDSEVVERDESAGYDLVKNVSHPTLQFYPSDPNAPTVVVCPGGGYYVEAIEHEGTEIVERLVKHGFNAALLKYRLPNRDVDVPLHKAPLQDAQRAIRLLKSRAAELHIDAKRIGIMGFSAGAHLSAMASNQTTATYDAVDAADANGYQPAFTILVYPAFLAQDNSVEPKDELIVTFSSPPAFVVQTLDDCDHVSSALAYGIACHRAQVPLELHLFPTGGHGYGLRSDTVGISGWMDLLIAWLGQRP